MNSGWERSSATGTPSGVTLDSTSRTISPGRGLTNRHLLEVVESIEADPSVHLAGLGIGHDMSSYLRRSRVVDPDRILDRETARAILGFLAQP